MKANDNAIVGAGITLPVHRESARTRLMWLVALGGHIATIMLALVAVSDKVGYASPEGQGVI
jgi:hypothetical protein